MIRVGTHGIATKAVDGRVRLSVAAGEPWGQVVTAAIADGLSGVECLAGIPGTAGGTPIQNVGAYGQQVSDTIVTVRAYDRSARRVIEIERDRCGFGYRASIFRGSGRFVVLGVTFELERSQRGQPLRSGDLARLLRVEPGARPPLSDIAAAVLELRRQKGMVLDPADPDSVSAGSFFVNPIMCTERFAELERRAAERFWQPGGPPAWPQADGGVKTSAAWLIERAGFRRGFGAGRAGVSTKHTLALVNRGGATADDLVTLGRQIRRAVERASGVMLAPEPTFVGVRP